MERYPLVVQELYQTHQQWLYQRLRNNIGHSAEAADLVQDTFVKILQTRDILIGVHEPRAYLLTIARNLMLDKARRKRVEQAYLNQLADMQYVVDALPSVEQQVEMIQAIEQICHLLSRVSDKAQRAFLLHYLEGKTHKEVAEILEISTRMVQKYLAQCLLQCCKARMSIDF